MNREGDHSMIDRHIYKEVETAIKSKPVTLITGARQVGKTSLALLFAKNYHFNYVSLDSYKDRELARNDPLMFLSLHPWPLIIDEVQYAPELFDALEEVVNKEKIRNEKNYGMYILAGSQMYRLMGNVTESMAGRISIIHMLPLSRNEILGREEPVFHFDYSDIQKRAQANPLPPLELYEDIVKGFYPELYSNDNLRIQKFYSDYVETYVERDVSQLMNVKNKLAFRQFLELIASLTGQELIYDNVAKIVGVDKKTIMSWLSILLAGDIVYLLEPYHEFSIAKRIVKRPKIYFNDTGLACYLMGITSGDVLKSGIYSGRLVETYIINELRKSYINNGVEPFFYYYRDNNGNEIDLVIIQNGVLHRVECKSGMMFNLSAVKGFKQLDGTHYLKGQKAILCNTESLYSLGDDTYALPIAGI